MPLNISEDIKTLTKFMQEINKLTKLPQVYGVAVAIITENVITTHQFGAKNNDLKHCGELFLEYQHMIIED